MDQPHSSPLDTRSVAGRRTLRFESLDEILAELDRLEGRPLRTLGNWSAGQIFAHLAVPMNGAIDGVSFSTPWYIRVPMTFLKGWFLKGTMPPGFRLPPDAARALVPGPTTEADGLAQLRRAIRRLQQETHREPSPVMGHLSNDQWDQLQCRHCELHLSFIIPE